MSENTVQEADLEAILAQFVIAGELKDLSLLKKGHIHETYVSTWSEGGKSTRYVHQQLNSYVFPNLEAVMHNIDTVTAHIRDRCVDEEAYQTLQLVPVASGQLYHVHEDGSWWRTFRYVEDTVGYESCPDAGVAYESGWVCGQFACYVSDLPPTKMKITIPHFIDTPYRFEQFEKACREDVAGRVKECQEEIRFVQSNASRAALLMEALKKEVIPTRVSHNDTKIDNILFSQSTGKGVCIVDLDTCMPGSPLFDYGDLMRTTALLAREDEEDLSQIYVVKEFYEAVKDGFLSGCGEILTEEERRMLPEMPPLVSLTLGIRFLADYLSGDKYFKIHHPKHNRARARAQFQVTRELAKH